MQTPFLPSEPPELIDNLPLFARCGVCGGTWDNDATVQVKEHSEDTVPLSQFVGQTIEDARSTLAFRGQQGGVMYDLSPFVQSKGHPTHTEVEWTYIVQSGDRGFALVTTYSHLECCEDDTEEEKTP